MIRRSDNTSESWRKLPWKQFRRNLFRLQRLVYKAVRAGDKRKAKSLQRLILKSTAARLLAVRQVTQLNQGKKTAGIDGKASFTVKERLELSETLRCHASNWKHQGLREIPIPKKDGKTRILKVPTMADRAWQCLAKYALEPAHEATFHARSYGFRTGRSAQNAQKYLFDNLNSKESKQNRYSVEKLIEKAFPTVPYSENKHINVKGGKSPFDGDIAYWSERNSKLYYGDTSKALKRQNHTCGYCGLKLLSDERVHLHHVDGNHCNWKQNNLLAIHESCHSYIHTSKSES